MIVSLERLHHPIVATSLSTLFRARAPATGAEPRVNAQRLDVRALFDAHYASIWRLLRRLGVPEAQVDDAAQEVFWVAARRIADIDLGRAHSFLYGVALRVASQERRKRAIVPLGDDDLDDVRDHAPSPEEQLDQRRARALLDAVLDRMPDDLRSVFVLFELEGLEVKAIADLHEIPLGTASSRLRRAREEFAAISKRVRTAVERGGRP